ncbi:MAG: FKBP-type peptidyl-prolyl cis-trans isomerase [Muribaculaceae bacterium]|nr:FKBP-type peptidyl-prolyl cis-trans isomerase [Muribaculaceae bacterium]
MEKIEPGKYVELGYDLYEIALDGKETLVHQTDSEDPERIIFGVTPGMIKPLEQAIEGLEANGTFNIVVKAEDAFGKHDPEQVVELEKEIFVVDGKFDTEMIKVGALVPMMTADGYRINGKVTGISADKVTMDFNHPLAGKDVRFNGKIITVREATPEELQPAHGCGGCGGNCGGGCDCDDSHSCGEGCGGCH